MPQKKIYRLDTSRWNVERAVFMAAGIFILTFSILGFTLNPLLHYASFFVGFMLVFFSLTGYCPMAIFLDKLFKRKEKRQA